MSDPAPPVAVLGAGAWGTALACLQAHQGRPVRLWARRPDFAAQLARDRENRDYLPGTTLPDGVEPTGDLRVALTGVTQIIVAAPSHGLREVTRQACEHLEPGALVICATKGLEHPSGLRMSQVLQETLGTREPRLVALSGPNLSAEIIAGEPAISVAAAENRAAALAAQELLSNSLFRVYTNSDIIGVEFCGAIKNVIAIGAGISDGLGFGNNAKAALLTRGMAEIRRLGLRLGAQPDTFAGIAGMGDLIATCHSHHSRNWTVGYRLGRGESPDEITSSLHSVAEGIYTTFATRDKAREVGVEMPITETLAQVLAQEISPADGVKSLMTRRWRAEEE
ncbi:MAG: NAD(P)-dependent glycerol-3-phosphate dehydrogenase [Armatimonadetes bacterium]|nr:NAD(P)-dependent glycerol-3-phosphate dehydrogenase [Armatimonadota bacterium]